jgi:hypothetical protein
MITPSFSLTATERVLPRLALDFTTASLDSRVTFTRTTGTSNPATYVDSSGYVVVATNNQPRFDYDPVTLACKGLLIEEARTNLFAYSQEFDNAYWTNTNTAETPDAIVSPDGTTNAEKLTSNATGTVIRDIRRTTTYTAGFHTLSVYAKAAEVSSIALDVGQGYGFAQFNLSTGQVTGTPSGTATIVNAGGGWYRCSISANVAESNNRTNQIFLNNRGSSTNIPVGDGVYIWGAQLEAGAFPTSYIPTTTTALTRNADVATITGTNFSDFWQAVKGGASVIATPSTVSGIRPLVQFDDNTADNIIALRGNTTNPELYIVDGGAPQVQLDAGTIVANTPYSLTGWWQTNDCKARKDSGAVVTDTTATIPTVTQARIGSDGTNYLNGTIATINYYDSFFGRPIYTRRKNKVFASLL